MEDKSETWRSFSYNIEKLNQSAKLSRREMLPKRFRIHSQTGSGLLTSIFCYFAISVAIV